MKVAFTERAKKFITLEEAPKAREIIASLKEENIKDLAQTAANIAGGSDTYGSDTYEILKATAEIAKNSRVNDYYDNGTGKLDVWLEIYAYNEYKGFYNIGVYLSDLWQLGGDNSDEIRKHMYLQIYTK